MKLIYFLGGFLLCYYLDQKGVQFPEIKVLEWGDTIRFSVNGKEYELNIADTINIGGSQVTYTPERNLNIVAPTGQSFNFNPGGG